MMKCQARNSTAAGIAIQENSSWRAISFRVAWRIAMFLVLAQRIDSFSAMTRPVLSRADEIRLLTRRIQACRRKGDLNATKSLLRNWEPCLTGEKDEDAPYLEALQVCGKLRAPDEAIQIFRLCPTDQCCSLTISILGRCNRHRQAMALVAGISDQFKCIEDEVFSGHSKREYSPGVYNALVAACSRCHSWSDALHVYKTMPQGKVSAMTVKIVLASLSKAKQGMNALEVLNSLDCRDGSPEGATGLSPTPALFHVTIQALLKSNHLREAIDLLGSMKARNLVPDQGIYDLFEAHISTSRKEWDSIPSDAKAFLEIEEPSSFSTWNTLTKHSDKGKPVFWELGKLNIDGTIYQIGAQPNRNARKNGIRLILVDEMTRERLGFLLMINSLSDGGSSQLLGMRLDEVARGNGWSKLLLAVWLKSCFEAGISPRTGKIHKPLLALVLGHTFGMEPVGGIACKLAPASKSSGHAADAITLFPLTSKSLEGVFSPSDLKNQRIRLANAPIPQGRTIHVSSTWVAPSDRLEIVRQTTAAVLDQKYSSPVGGEELRQIFLGCKTIRK